MNATEAKALASSDEIRDRGSVFVGRVYRARTADEVVGVLNERLPKGRRRGESDSAPVYAMAAWRHMVVRAGKTGLGGPDDFEVREGCQDGDERGAGKRVLGAMRREGVLDAVVVVFRRFGGTLLGPVRFEHVDKCAGDACQRFKRVEETDECVETLRRLDALLGTLRARLAEMRGETAGEGRKQDYATLDHAKLRRLVQTRQCAIENTNRLIVKYTST